jgi:hypothetical protein
MSTRLKQSTINMFEFASSIAFWCNQAESGGAIVKKPRQLIECQRVPTPSLTKTDSTVYISLKT